MINGWFVLHKDKFEFSNFCTHLFEVFSHTKRISTLMCSELCVFLFQTILNTAQVQCWDTQLNIRWKPRALHVLSQQDKPAFLCHCHVSQMYCDQPFVLIISFYKGYKTRYLFPQKYTRTETHLRTLIQELRSNKLIIRLVTHNFTFCIILHFKNT